MTEHAGLREGYVPKTADARYFADTGLAPCYSFLAFLNEREKAVIKDCIRPTFTETWDEIGNSRAPGDMIDRVLDSVIRSAGLGQRYWLWSGHPDHVHTGWTAKGRLIEAALYAKARQLGLPVIMGPAR